MRPPAKKRQRLDDEWSLDKPNIDKILHKDADDRTTIMVTNLPTELNLQQFKALIDKNDQEGRYNYLHMPISRVVTETQKCRQVSPLTIGKAFINFISPLFIVEFFSRFEGKKFANGQTCKLFYAPR